MEHPCLIAAEIFLDLFNENIEVTNSFLQFLNALLVLWCLFCQYGISLDRFFDVIDQDMVQLQNLVSDVLFNDQRRKNSIVSVVSGDVYQVGHTNKGLLVDEIDHRMNLFPIFTIDIF